MAYEFKRHDSLVSEHVKVVTDEGLTLTGEIIGDTPDGYYFLNTEDEGQEYFIPKRRVCLVAARSRHLVGTPEER